jgi:hypothetical protein
MAVVHVKTTSGFECDIDEIVLDDMEVLDYLAAIEGGDLMKYPPLLSKLFAPKVKKALYDHVRAEDGRVPYTAFDAEITDIFNAIRGGKN